MIDEVLDLLGEGSEALFADGFDAAIVGVDLDLDRVIYDKDKMVDILVEDEDMDPVEAIEHLEYNVWGAYVGVHTPMYIYTVSGDF